MSKILPSLQSYPIITPLNLVPELDNRLVYIIKGYPLSGFSVLVFRSDGRFGIKAGDFDGNTIEPHCSPIAQYYDVVIKLMEMARIQQAQFYFSDSKLVDIRTALDKMVSPGMLKDLCGNLLPTQEIIKVQKLDEDLKEELKNMGYVILKHSSFKVIIREDKVIPLYGMSGYEDQKSDK